MRRTRIVCTLGPASSSPAVLRQMVAAGMDVARFNFSHGDAGTHHRAAAAVREAAVSLGRHVALLQDLQGPKIRTGRLSEPLVRLSRGRRLTLTAEPVAGNAELISVSHPEIVCALRPRDRVLMADGQIELRVETAAGNRATCVIIRGGLLGERKGITVPSRTIELPALTEKDHADLCTGAEIGVDYVALSFVRSPADVTACRRALAALGLQTPVIAKLERAEALRNLRAILACVDGVMVARGDLGVELPLGALPPAQKDIIERANRLGPPVITATEMLESMVTSNRPTRAEASDVANAIWDGTDAVMLSQETSIGAHPVEAVRAMARICLAAEVHPSYQRAGSAWQPDSIGGAMSQAAAAIAVKLKARAIVAFTESGTTARLVSKARPSTPIIGASPHSAILRRTALYAGVRPLLVPQGEDTDDMIAKATAAAAAAGLVKRGDRLVFVAGVPVGKAGVTNLVKVEVVG